MRMKQDTPNDSIQVYLVRCFQVKRDVRKFGDDVTQE